MDSITAIQSNIDILKTTLVEHTQPQHCFLESPGLLAPRITSRTLSFFLCVSYLCLLPAYCIFYPSPLDLFFFETCSFFTTLRFLFYIAPTFYPPVILIPALVDHFTLFSLFIMYIFIIYLFPSPMFSFFTRACQFCLTILTLNLTFKHLSIFILFIFYLI